MLEHRLMEFIVNLFKQFMLTARNTEDYLCVPRNGMHQRIIRSGIAGMQRNDHIGGSVGIVCNVSHEKF